MDNRNKYYVIKNLMALGLVSLSTGLQAEDSSIPQEIEEITVTASKAGAVSVQNIASNISALGEESLKNVGAVGIKDFERYVPGLTSILNSPGSTRFILRGLSSTAGSVQVGTYYDELLAVGRVGPNVFQTDLQLVDIERIEVLRGPQGTLYGAGSQGGTIRYITKKPDLTEVSGALELEASTRQRGAGEAYKYRGVLNVPVVEDVFGIRAVLYRNDEDGNVDFPNIGAGLENVGDIEITGGRLMLAWNIGDKTQLTGSIWHQEMEADDSGSVEEGGEFRTARVIQPSTDELSMYNLTLEHDFGVGSSTATASYVERETFFAFDVSQFFVPPMGPGLPASVNQEGETELFSAEIRYASNLEGPVQFIVGAFYQDREAPEAGLGNGYFGDPATGLPFDPVGPMGQFFGSATTEEFSNKAIFGEVTYSPTDRLEFLYGLRFFELESEFQSEETFNPFTPAAGLGPVLKSTSNDEVSKFQVSFDVTENILIYALYSEGFREGGPNAIGLLTGAGLPVPESYVSDKVENIELGWKTQFFDNQLTFNGSIYRMEWDDIQSRLSDVNGAFAYIENSGKAELEGIEIETRFQPSALEGLTLMLNLNYATQELDEDSPGVALGDPTAGRAGDSIPDSAEKTGSVVIEQRFTLFERDAFFILDATYTGEALTQFSTRSPMARKIGDYWLTGSRVGIQGDNWNGSLFVKNIFNERKPHAWDVPEIPGLADKIFTTPPRTLGLSLRYEF